MKLRDLKAKRAALNKVLQKLASLNKDLKAKKKKKKVCVVNLSTLKTGQKVRLYSLFRN